jgi:hypothetical protein
MLCIINMHGEFTDADIILILYLYIYIPAMIPPCKYLTFRHNYFGSVGYNGKENFKKLYKRFLKDPYLNECKSFNNKLSDVQMRVLKGGCICIVFVLPVNYRWEDIWEGYEHHRNKLVGYIKTTQINEHLIEAWDILFKRADSKLKNSYAIIGLECIMDAPFDRSVMVPGNIFITSGGKVILNNLNVDDYIGMLKRLSTQTDLQMIQNLSHSNY